MRMSLQLLILLLVLVGCTALVARGQSVSARSNPDDENGLAESEGDAGSQTRTIYSHKHLSPHRMMHFGKRLLVQQPPEIYTTTNQVLDPYHRQPFDLQQQVESESFPYIFYFPMPRDRVFESVQPGVAERNRQMMNAMQNMFGPSRQQQAGCEDNISGQQAQFRQQTSVSAQPKMMRLMKATDGLESGDSSSSSNGGSENIYTVKKQSPSVGGDAQQQSEIGQQEQHDASGTSNGYSEGNEIDRASRSVGPARPLLPGLTRAQFSMLFGNQPSPSSQATSLLNFIKKAEPQRMTFMHFGRRR